MCRRLKTCIILCLTVIVSLVVFSCSSNQQVPTLYIGGIPDQEISRLEDRFNAVAAHLADDLNVAVEYVPTVDYAALVTAFRLGDIQLGWFGGLTGVQARLATPGSIAVAQRPRDKEFKSVFIVQSGVQSESLVDLRGLTFTFGSESSTSGHLMPRHFLIQSGLDPDSDFNGPPSYSGSHDKTWKLVEAGAYQAGALNAAVWERAVAEVAVDLSKVSELYITPSYYDYHWVLRGGIDDEFGDGFAVSVRDSLLGIEQEEILGLFQANSFIPTKNENYDSIESVARALNLIE